MKPEYTYLEEVAEIIMGQSPESSTYNDKGQGLPFFQGKAEFGDKCPIAKKWCSSPLKIAEPKDILLSVRAPVGPTNICNVKSCIGRGLAAIRCKKSMDYLFLWFYLSSIEKRIAGRGVGSTFTAVGRSEISKIKVPLMEYNTQRRIASILEKAESAKQKRQEANRLTDEFLKSAFIEMFGDPIKSQENVNKLAEVCELNPRLKFDIPDNKEISFVPMSAVSTAGEIDTNQVRIFGEVKTGFTYFQEGDVLFAKITPCMENGKGGIAKGLKNGIGFGSTEFHVLRPTRDTVSEWIYFLLSFEHVRAIAAKNMTGTAGQKRVPVSFLQNLKVSVPPVKKQQKFADLAQKVEALKTKQRQSEQELNNLFDSLMQKAFRGELV